MREKNEKKISQKNFDKQIFFFDKMADCCYPKCEADDCYCKRHFPNRSGGEEHEVYDTVKSEWIILCDVALDNKEEVSDCALKDHKMLGSLFLDLGSSRSDSNAKHEPECRICWLCVDTWLDLYVKDSFQEHPCLFYKMLNYNDSFYNDFTEWENCEQCKNKYLPLEYWIDVLPIVGSDWVKWLKGEFIEDYPSPSPKFREWLSQFPSWYHAKKLSKRMAKKRKLEENQITFASDLQKYIPSLTMDQTRSISKCVSLGSYEGSKDAMGVIEVLATYKT